MVHETHSPVHLRARIQSILLSRASERVGEGKGANIIISHPPPSCDVSIDGKEGNGEMRRGMSSIEPIANGSLDLLPLSTHSPRSCCNGFEARTREEWQEEDFPLVLVTGGSGFIGSHTVLEILQAGEFGVVVIDNLKNSHIEVLSRVRTLAAQYWESQPNQKGRIPPLYFHPVDIRERNELEEVMSIYATGKGSSRIISAIHFAALKSVAGSLQKPIDYYQTNVAGTLNLISVLSTCNAKKIVFSSSAVVYGAGCDGEGIVEADCDIRDGGGKGITNPYGRTKRMCEEILSDLAESDENWQTMSLRYTNPSGAHPSGWIGEDPTNAANLMPIVTHVLQGKRKEVLIYGADYDTPDGTGVRDFIHVVDLAKAHLAAISALHSSKLPQRCTTYNIGTNVGTSVLTVIETLSLVAQRSIRIAIMARRPGDLGSVVCSSLKAEVELDWKAKRGLAEMCRDLVNWQALNPDGYGTARTL